MPRTPYTADQVIAKLKAFENSETLFLSGFEFCNRKFDYTFESILNFVIVFNVVFEKCVQHFTLLTHF